jgi:hypothetical protein
MVDSTCSKHSDQDLATGYVTGIGEHRCHEVEPQPGSHSRNGRGDDRALAVERLAHTHGTGDGTGRRIGGGVPHGGGRRKPSWSLACGAARQMVMDTREAAGGGRRKAARGGGG